MLHISRRFTLAVAITAIAFGGSNRAKPKVENTVAVLWRAPDDLSSRNLFYGSGGETNQPRGTVTFEREDLDGTNPKFVVKDRDGVKWTVKMGEEVRSETAASRLVWAAGYFTNDDYYVADLRVENMPSHLKRGSKFITLEGARNVRLKRHDPGEKKIGEWSWRDEQLRDRREWNGLRTVMALINNWDLKDLNNAIYLEKKTGEQVYMISDLGASFGAPAHIFPHRKSKDDLSEYSKSKFIKKETPEFITFSTPGRPSIIYAGAIRSYVKRVHLEWLGKDVPRADARWMGEILGRLSHDQIRDAFRAAGYSPAETQAFAQVVETRIAKLRSL